MLFFFQLLSIDRSVRWNACSAPRNLCINLRHVSPLWKVLLLHIYLYLYISIYIKNVYIFPALWLFTVFIPAVVYILTNAILYIHILIAQRHIFSPKDRLLSIVCYLFLLIQYLRPMLTSINHFLFNTFSSVVFACCVPMCIKVMNIRKSIFIYSANKNPNLKKKK